MNSEKPTSRPIAYRLLSYCILAGFVYYWVLTIGSVFFDKSIRETVPRQAAFYYTFWGQGWRLFAYTVTYKRELDFIIRDKINTSKADTIELVRYSIAEKRKRAPFNNYSDALDQMLFGLINDLEGQLLSRQKVLKKQLPGQPDSFYVRQSIALVLADSLHPIPFQNLVNYGKFIAGRLNLDTVGKEYKIELFHRYIAPEMSAAGSLTEGDKNVIFLSSFKSFQ